MSGITRVVFVTHSRRLYGASRSLLVLLDGFRAAGVETHTILPGPGPMADALAVRGFAATQVPFGCWVVEERAGGDAAVTRAEQARAAADLSRHLERIRPDVVWSNSLCTSVGALAAAALGVPHIWHLREINTPPSPYRFAVGSAAAVEMMRAARARIAVSRQVAAVYEALCSGPCETIYNGIGAVADLAGRAAPPRRPGPLRILLPGRVQRNKGQLAALAAVRRLIESGRDVRLRIVGEGDLGAVAASLIHLGLRDVVTLVGFVDDIDAEYRRADVVLSCGTLEAMGRVTAEAMSYGLPVIGCANGGTLDLLEHEVTGLLCDGTAAGMEQALMRLLRDPDAARRLGARAQDVARERFNNERCVAASLAVLNRIVAAQPGRGLTAGHRPHTPISRPV